MSNLQDCLPLLFPGSKEWERDRRWCFSPFNALSLSFEKEQVRIVHNCQTIRNCVSFPWNWCLTDFSSKKALLASLFPWKCFPCLIVSLKMFISFLVHMVASSGSCPLMGSCADVRILELQHTETTFKQSIRAPCRWEAWQIAHQFVFYCQCGGAISRGNLLNKAGIEIWSSSIDNCQWMFNVIVQFGSVMN